MACLLFLSIVNARAQDTLTVTFLDMTPHVGQNLYLRVVDTLGGMEIGRDSLMVETDSFALEVVGLVPEHSYNVDFWADHNNNGTYDPPSADHAWRIPLDSVWGDTAITFTHNTNFMDIEWPREVEELQGLTIAFSNFTPHLGQNLYLALEYQNGWELERKKILVESAAFNVTFDTIIVDSSYQIDFWADHNLNGQYDIPPDDHAWRLTVDSVRGDTTIAFVHNTDFIDIDWTNKLTVDFTAMNPHLNQVLYFYLRDQDTGEFIDSLIVDPITDAEFSVSSMAIMPDSSYNVDFYVDFNENGMYDIPPTDHAWRIVLDDVNGDTTISFVHNTDFIDIGLESDTTVTGITDLNQAGFSTYPNPVKDVLTVRAGKDREITGNMRIFSQTGALLVNKVLPEGKTEVTLNVAALKPGVYILTIGEGKNIRQTRFVKE